ncbi:lysine N(6)-hydroxylase/L-ornithine N(5)-oxygenase family protein [Falsibacillus albus]|uniref:L-lysine N6-monooxygenase MbtG n=1 Tax=Falsibacillus albus TaxID=2478915 RepID=A0A3L7JVD2_9BACI|nr:SidA/IucD/PvdA family monooxygenase [Falsibacillus albus]RLQ94490.1 ornithine monooxygenase [Falsibacillus albus]
MEEKDLLDVVGIGIGPYNLGLAALLEETDLRGMFFDQTPAFEWHPGMLIDGTDLQVPILADLVTFADPRSRFTFLNYLHEHNRLYKFFFFNKNEIPRQEYNRYAQWVAGQLESCFFGKKVVDVIDHMNDESPHYEVIVEDRDSGELTSHFSKHVVMGTGAKPLVVNGMEGLPDKDVFHSNRYLYHKDDVVKSGSVTIVGSGQSAAEIFLDLLKEQRNRDYKVTWFTRSEGILQLESSKLGQEFFSPDYIEYFHPLSFEQRKSALSTLEHLRKGIDPSTLNAIYNVLYHRSVEDNTQDILIQPLTEVKEISRVDDGYRLSCHQWQEGDEFDYESKKVVLATGYKPNIPDWFDDRFRDQIVWEDEKRFKVSRDYQLVFKEEREHHFFTLTNLEHSHGAAATNLGLSVDRNIHIINTIAGKELYRIQTDTIFSQFTMDKK